ncbi:MAG: hypothetical protein MUO72_05930 [Bacteroidales bacterium]|nr:hypothetical protein [Bacteroidales bacterium]
MLTKMKRIAFILIFLSTAVHLYSQNQSSGEPIFPRYNIGIGAGIDYGGFGGRFSVLTSERLEFFGAIGYNLLGLGFNAGVDIRILPLSRICPFVGAMYGYNAVIKVTGTELYNRIYYGPSWAIGLEFWLKRHPYFLNLELIVPIRSSEFHDDIKSLKNNPNITFTNELLPVGLGIGFHFSF